jgi:hypothetical protein
MKTLLIFLAVVCFTGRGFAQSQTKPADCDLTTLTTYILDYKHSTADIEACTRAPYFSNHLPQESIRALAKLLTSELAGRIVGRRVEVSPGVFLTAQRSEVEVREATIGTIAFLLKTQMGEPGLSEALAPAYDRRYGTGGW